MINASANPFSRAYLRRGGILASGLGASTAVSVLAAGPQCGLGHWRSLESFAGGRLGQPDKAGASPVAQLVAIHTADSPSLATDHGALIARYWIPNHETPTPLLNQVFRDFASGCVRVF